jgi:hypothetical protein
VQGVLRVPPVPVVGERKKCSLAAYGAQTRSRSSLVLVDQSAEEVMAARCGARETLTRHQYVAFQPPTSHKAPHYAVPPTWT